MEGLDKKASYALSQSVRSSKEAFQNYRALDVNTDQYCRLAGALNPESSDTAGRNELMGIFNSGYQEKTGLAAIKKYLTDMYDRAINPALDANKSDSQGGRKDSVRKCFGLNVRDPIVLTNERIGSGSTTGSSRQQFDVPPNPGLSPAHCLFEVGSPDARSPWKGNPVWEANAPPLGSGVYWLWGTSDGFGERPANEAFSFYHNFVNTGSTVTNAIIAGAVDNYGYVVLNGTKYPSTNVHSDKGYEGFNNIIQPFTVTIPRGPNTLEVRCVNSSSGVTAAQNNGAITNPAGMWLTIKVNNNFIVKTGCEGWKCTRFFYPQEVFHITGYNKTLADAPAVCQSVGARVATYAELDEAQKNHANWCSTGWVSDKGDKNAFYPITYDIMGGCGNGRSGIIDWIGNDDWFKSYIGAPSGFRAGVNCFGNKPEELAANRMLSNNTPAFSGLYGVTNRMVPYNKNQWSRYSPGTSPPVVSPPLPPVTINQHCGGDGWSRTLTGPKVFNSGADYPSDVSFIRVPSGVTVVISYNGRSFTIVGPRNFNACGGSGDWWFNDKMTTIEIRATGSSDANSAATPPPAPRLPAVVAWQGYVGDRGRDGYQWSRELVGPGVFISGNHFPHDISTMRIPSGVRVVVKSRSTPIYGVNGTGGTYTAVGPRDFSLLDLAPGGGANGINDNIESITISSA
jgi:hypothetical protein